MSSSSTDDSESSLLISSPSTSTSWLNELERPESNDGRSHCRLVGERRCEERLDLVSELMEDRESLPMLMGRKMEEDDEGENRSEEEE